MKSRSSYLYRTIAVCVALVLVAVAILLATPQGRAWAQEILRFFSRAESDTLPLQPWQLTPPSSTSPADAYYIDHADQPVSEVEKQAGFDVLEPTWLPEDISFTGATFETERHIVRLFYSHRQEQTNGFMLKEEPFQRSDSCELCNMVGVSAKVEMVQIGNVTGEYVEGVWKLTDDGSVWEPDPFLKTLRWQAAGMAFELLYMGQPEDVTMADMIAVAESIE